MTALCVFLHETQLREANNGLKSLNKLIHYDPNFYVPPKFSSVGATRENPKNFFRNAQSKAKINYPSGLVKNVLTGRGQGICELLKAKFEEVYSNSS
jgi:hypothetical protein